MYGKAIITLEDYTYYSADIIYVELNGVVGEYKSATPDTPKEKIRLRFDRVILECHDLDETTEIKRIEIEELDICKLVNKVGYKLEWETDLNETHQYYDWESGSLVVECE